MLKTIPVRNTSVPLGDFDACDDFGVNIVLFLSYFSSNGRKYAVFVQVCLL